MLADLHSHYPMHLLDDWASGRGDRGPASTVARLRRVRKRPDKFKAFILSTLSRRINWRTPTSGPRVTVDAMEAGDVGLLLSVMYSPFAEIDLDHPFQADPRDDYFGELEILMDLVRDDLARPENAKRARLVKTAAEFEAARSDGVCAVVHCVEGGVHLGESHAAILGNVKKLADAGVAYITIAHLFWRGYATNVNAIPFIPTWLYKLLFPMPEGESLSERGETAVRAMIEHGIIVDLAHMDERALESTWKVLDEAPDMPVILTHAGYRFGKQEYMAGCETIERIAARDGVIGLIMAQHQLNDGIRRKTKTFEESLDTIFRHIDQIHEVTKSFDNIALGSDLDGFIKPTMTCVEAQQDLDRLRKPLADRYGQVAADKIRYGNVERVLQTLWSWKRARTRGVSSGASPPGTAAR
jgi:microsomal dipeptidase-like Zn-dependent dipeptidase